MTSGNISDFVPKQKEENSELQNSITDMTLNVFFFSSGLPTYRTNSTQSKSLFILKPVLLCLPVVAILFLLYFCLNISYMSLRFSYIVPQGNLELQYTQENHKLKH